MIQHDDRPNVGLNILSAIQVLLCCPLPILGVILYFVWRDERPQAAKSMLFVTLISFGVAIVLFTAALIFGLFAFISAMISSGVYY